MSLECFLKPWKKRQNNELHADFLINCARKNVFFGVRAEIFLSQVIATQNSCAGPFLGCAEILIFGEIFTSAWSPSQKSCYLMEC